jgi:DUF1680 family protein
MIDKRDPRKCSYQTASGSIAEGGDMKSNTAQSPDALLKTRPLKNLCWKVDRIDSTFGTVESEGIPEHSDIELALVDFFRGSSQTRYLALAAFFVDQRQQRSCSCEELTQRRHIEQINKIQAMRFGSHNSSVFHEENEYD